MCVVCVIISSVMYVLSTNFTYFSFSTLPYTVYAASSLSKVSYVFCTTHNNVNVDSVQSYITGNVPGPPLSDTVQSMEPCTWVDCIACMCRMLSCIPSPFC